MTSLCNYTHPDRHITDGLERTGQGVVFPYNPEFYDRVSGLYGPGSCFCWFLLMGSFIINMTSLVKGGRVGLSNDLLAVVAFPVFAATDAVVQAIRWVGTEYRGLAILCVKFPDMDLSYVAKFKGNQTVKLDLKEIPADVLELGQHALDINGPLSVICIFNIVFFPLVALFFINDTVNSQKTSKTSKTGLCPTFAARWCVYGSYIYIVLALAVVHFSLGDFNAMLELAMLEWVTPVLIFMFWAFCVFLVLGFLGSCGMIISGLGKGDRREAVGALKGFGSCIAMACLLPLPIFLSTKLSDLSPVPDLGVSIKERDQIATLVVGIVSLCFTIADTLRKWGRDTLLKERDAEERDAEETQALTAVAEGSGFPARDDDDGVDMGLLTRRSLDSAG